MEDQRGQFVVIVAGYTDNMRPIYGIKSRIESRFDKTFLFEDYTPEELTILLCHCYKKKISSSMKVLRIISKISAIHLRQAHKIFRQWPRSAQGDWRSSEEPRLRVASMPKEQRTPEIPLHHHLRRCRRIQTRGSGFWWKEEDWIYTTREREVSILRRHPRWSILSRTYLQKLFL